MPETKAKKEMIMKSNEKKITKIIVFDLAIILGMSILDYLYIPSLSFNWDFMSIITNIVIAISLFIITYILIDKYNIEKQENQTQAAAELLQQTYQNCLKSIELLEKPDMRSKAAQRCDFNKTLLEDKFFSHFLEQPFEHDTLIFDCANNGSIKRKTLHEYLSIQKEVKDYMMFRITFFDVTETNQAGLFTQMKNDHDHIRTDLMEAIKKLETNELLI
jgi:hypothetical protein